MLGLTLKMSKGCQEMLRRAKVATGRQSTCWAMLNEYGLVWPNIHDDTGSILDEVEPIQVARPNVGIMVGSFFKNLPIKKLPIRPPHSPSYLLTTSIYLVTPCPSIYLPPSTLFFCFTIFIIVRCWSFSCNCRL